MEELPVFYLRESKPNRPKKGCDLSHKDDKPFGSPSRWQLERFAVDVFESRNRRIGEKQSQTRRLSGSPTQASLARRRHLDFERVRAARACRRRSHRRPRAVVDLGQESQQRPEALTVAARCSRTSTCSCTTATRPPSATSSNAKKRADLLVDSVKAKTKPSRFRKPGRFPELPNP